MGARRRMTDLFTAMKEAYGNDPEGLESVEKSQEEISQAAAVLASVALYITQEPKYSIEITVNDPELKPRVFEISVKEKI